MNLDDTDSGRGGFKIDVLFGTMKLEPIKYRVVKYITKRRFWFDKVEYAIETQYTKIAGFKSVSKCLEVLAYGGIPLKDIDLIILVIDGKNKYE